MDVLEQLLVGATDEAAAARLYVSLRTYRRKVSEVLALLGVQSRFQAGAVAERRQYLDLVHADARGQAPDPYIGALEDLRNVRE